MAAGRGIAALPGWLADQYSRHLPIVSRRLGRQGIMKHIYLGVREGERNIEYLQDFIRLAKHVDLPKMKQS